MACGMQAQPFYRDVLGFQTQWNGGSFADFETAGGELSLFMYSREAEYERLSKLDVQFPTGEPVTHPFGIRNFYVADPEENLLEIGSANAV